MDALISRRRLCTWIALVAMLCGVLAPTISRAISWQHQVQAPLDGAVCSVDPAAHMGQHAGTAGQTAPGHASVLEHCPFCSIHVPQADLPPSSEPMVQVIATVLDLPEPCAWGQVAPQAWAKAQPRAPPSIS